MPCSGKEVRVACRTHTLTTSLFLFDVALRAPHAGSGGDDVQQLRQDRGPGQRVAQQQAGGGRAALPALLQQGGTCTHVALTMTRH